VLREAVTQYIRRNQRALSSVKSVEMSSLHRERERVV
jgi:hypothetical protein